ncbi:MAG: hypothetical protein RBS56_03045 [Candidatus Gracilibacteria bacterium]|jgi:hypothetical protein|nr:hypothetical protein [Candidatus Gracilibacteria bacterium]
MKKIKIFDESVVDLRGESEEVDFDVSPVSKKEEEEKTKGNGFTPVDLEDFSMGSVKSTNMVRVRFDKFITLLSKYDFESALSKFTTQEIIITTDLLADLANPPELEEVSEEPKKFPYMILVGGVIVGILISWLIFK